MDGYWLAAITLVAAGFMVGAYARRWWDKL